MSHWPLGLLFHCPLGFERGFFLSRRRMVPSILASKITVRNKYPLLLLNAAFSPLQKGRMLTKLDLRNAYHLVRIRSGDE